MSDMNTVNTGAAAPQDEPIGYLCRHNAQEKWFFSDVPGYWEHKPVYERAALPAQADHLLQRAEMIAQAVASVPKGFALVPVRLTRAMCDVMDEEGWQWHGLLAVADAITEEEYAELEAPAQDLAPSDAQSKWANQPDFGRVGDMTPERAAFFLERFKRDEKMLGANEQWALDFAIDALAAPDAPQAVPDADAWTHLRVGPFKTSRYGYYSRAEVEHLNKRPGTQEHGYLSINPVKLYAAAQTAAQPADAQADMFWDEDDTERNLMASSEEEAIREIADEASLRDLPFEVVLLRAKTLPKLRVRVTALADDEGKGFTYEAIDAARTQEGAAS